MLEMLNCSLSGLVQVFTWFDVQPDAPRHRDRLCRRILPGIGGATTLALMLPFIIKMNAFEAFAFLLGMLAVTATTGDITLFCLVCRAKRRRSRRSLTAIRWRRRGSREGSGSVLMSSLIGRSLALLLWLWPYHHSPIIETFGSPEFFMLAMLGLTFVASLSGGALVKGLIAGGLGLFLSTIGLDPVTGIKRFTFGQLFLWTALAWCRSHRFLRHS